MCTGRLISSGRSSTCSCPHGGILRRRTVLRASHRHDRGHTQRGRHRPGADLPAGVGGTAPGGVASHRPVRQQRGRVRSRSVEGAVAADARAQTGPQRQGRDRWARAGAERPTRARRAGGRGAGEPAVGGCVRRARRGDLIRAESAPPACPGSAQCNSTHAGSSRPGKPDRSHQPHRKAVWGAPSPAATPCSRPRHAGASLPVPGRRQVGVRWTHDGTTSDGRSVAGPHP
jgi:hypothetical protein